MENEQQVIMEPPRGFRRILSLGPGLVWAASAVGVGSLVFATRAGAIFGLVLIWAPVLTITLKYFMTELVGRYTISTGENVVTAFGRVSVSIGPLRLPAGWIIWIFWLFFIVSIAGMSGISLAVGSSLFGLFPNLSYVTWALVSLAAIWLILMLGSYRALEWTSRLLMLAVVFFVFYAVYKMPPGPVELVDALTPPRAPDNSLRELIPLLGWAGAGAIGTIWFSLWTQGSGRGAATTGKIPDQSEYRKIRGWIRVNQLDLLVSTILTMVLTVGFLLAGSSILRPLGLVPDGEEMGTVLAHIAGKFFGEKGEVIFLVGIFGTLFSTVLANIDGLCRVAASALGYRTGEKQVKSRPYRLFLAIYIIFSGLFATILPAPVILLQVTAGIDTLLLPVVACLAVYICKEYLPGPLQPGRIAVWITYFSAAFFAFFIVLLLTAMIRGVQFGL